MDLVNKSLKSAAILSNVKEEFPIFKGKTAETSLVYLDNAATT